MIRKTHKKYLCINLIYIYEALLCKSIHQKFYNTKNDDLRPIPFIQVIASHLYDLI